MALTIKQVERTVDPGRYGDGNGLYLQVTKTGAKSWLLRYERGGRERWMGLGPVHTFDLSEARERARKARQLLADGIDPLEARTADKAAKALEAANKITFEQASIQFFNQHERKWKNAKHRAQFLSTLRTYAFPVIGKLAVSAIDTGLVLRVLEPIWHDKTETASRVRGRIESVLNWATVRGYRTRDNPARWTGHLREVLPSRAQVTNVRHHAAMPVGEVPGFMTALRARAGVAARALEFTALTAARTGEVTGARWEELDLEQKVWTVPAERMKAGKEHRVPLSAQAVKLLEAMPREGEWLFPGGRQEEPMSNMAMAAVLKRMGVPSEKATVHGFRSSFRDWAAERTSYANEVVEMALAHTIKNKAEAAYRRGDLFEKRRRLMSDWAAFCDQVLTGATVTPLRQIG